MRMKDILDWMDWIWITYEVILLLSLFTSIVSASGHGLDITKNNLSDHCFEFKSVHNFHRPYALPAVKSPFRPWGNCSAPWFPQQQIWLKSKNHYHDETNEQQTNFLNLQS